MAVSAMFGFADTEKVPVERLLANLDRSVRANSNDLAASYQLARVHSMVFATNAISLNVTKGGEWIQFGWPGSDSGVPRELTPTANAASRQTAVQHLTNAIHYYERSLVLLRKGVNETNQSWLLPVHLGYAWYLDQAGRRDAAIKAYRDTLDIAWQEEVIGEFHFKEWLSERWEDIKARRNPLKGQRKNYVGPGVCFSAETIRYLLKLLDPVTDKKAIAELEGRQKELLNMGRAITPVVVPVGDKTELLDLVNAQAAVPFDLDGSGLQRPWGWIKPEAAWLVFDRDHQGNINSGLQMLGAVSFWIFWENGYQALAALDDNGDGLVEGHELEGLALWRDRDGNGVSEPGEVRPVADWGITALSTAHRRHESGCPWSPRGVPFGDGDWRPTYD